MSRDFALGGGIAGSVWALFHFGFVHSPELLGVIGPLLRLSERFAWLPSDPLRKLWMGVTVLVLLFGLYRLAESAIERFNV